MTKRQKKKLKKRLGFKHYKSYKRYLKACRKAVLYNKNRRFYDPLLLKNQINNLNRLLKMNGKGGITLSII